MPKRPKITVIGGGTGSFTVLTGLKHLDVDLSALVSMVDDGGSTGQLRDDYGVLPPGDVRQCLVALSDAPLSLRNLFNFRFPGESPLGGHSFGNLFLSAVEMMTDNFSEAVAMASEILNIKGRVLPVTTEKCQLAIKLEGKETVGQIAVEGISLKKGMNPNLYLKPKAKLNPMAKKAIDEADIIIIAPGSLYSSTVPALMVENMAESLRNTNARVLYICNLVNKPNHTYDFKVTDYVSELERFVGKGVIDFVLYNIDMPSEHLLARYNQDDEYPVEIDENEFSKYNAVFIPGKFLSQSTERQDKNDTLHRRSLIRHDSSAIAKAVKGMMEGTV